MSTRGATTIRFTDRREAGVELAGRLLHYRGRDAVVLALPRGGVPVGYEVANRIDADLDIFVVRKIGMPGHREYAIGAIASGDVQFIDREVLRWYGVSEAAVDAVVHEERAELERREREYRGRSPLTPLADRVVILVDDGLATGSTMKAAVQAVRQHQPSRVVVAAPVGAPSTCRELSALADDIVCAAVGQFYVDFAQTTDEEVHALLNAHRRTHLHGGGAASGDEERP